MDLDKELSGLPVAEAAFYARLSLLLELATLADISDWADEVLLREDEPDEFFIALYRLLRTDKPRVRTYLDISFPAVTFSARPALGWLQRFGVGTWPLGQIIRSLYRLRTLVQTDQEVGWVYALAADYEQAAGDSAELLEAVARETVAFLGCYQGYTFANRRQWPQLDARLEERIANLRP